MIEGTLRAYMHSDEAVAAGRELRGMLDRWAQADDGLAEDEALALAPEEVHAYRRERRSRR